MSTNPTVTEEDTIILAKTANQQKNQIADKSKNRILKQTHNKKCPILLNS